MHSDVLIKEKGGFAKLGDHLPLSVSLKHLLHTSELSTWVDGTLTGSAAHPTCLLI